MPDTEQQTKKVDRRQLRTRRRIREAFIALVTEKGPEKLTVKELAQRADIDRKTFYLHYESISSVVEEMQNEFLEQLELLISEFDLFQPSFDALGFFRRLNAFIDENASFYRKIVMADRYSFFHEKLKEAMKELLRQKYHQKIVSSQISLTKLNLYTEYATAGIIAVYVQWLKHPDYSLEVVAEAASEIAYGGGRAVLEQI